MEIAHLAENILFTKGEPAMVFFAPVLHIQQRSEGCRAMQCCSSQVQIVQIQPAHLKHKKTSKGCPTHAITIAIRREGGAELIAFIHGSDLFPQCGICHIRADLARLAAIGPPSHDEVLLLSPQEIQHIQDEPYGLHICALCLYDVLRDLLSTRIPFILPFKLSCFSRISMAA